MTTGQGWIRFMIWKSLKSALQIKSFISLTYPRIIEEQEDTIWIRHLQLQSERDPTQLSLVSSCNVTVFKVYIKPFTFGVNVSSTKKALPFVILNMTFPALCMQF